MRREAATRTLSAGSLAQLTDTLTQLHQFAQQRRISMPVLDQITGHLERSYVHSTDELVVAFYRELTTSDTKRPALQHEEEEP